MEKEAQILKIINQYKFVLHNEGEAEKLAKKLADLSPPPIGAKEVSEEDVIKLLSVRRSFMLKEGEVKELAKKICSMFSIQPTEQVKKEGQVFKTNDDGYIYDATHQSEGKELSEWISVEDRLPEENQIVDVWEMPTTDRHQKIGTLRYTEYAKKYIGDYQFVGHRSTNYRFNKDFEEKCNCFLKVGERTLAAKTYPEYKELCVENGEVTHWKPVPQPPKQK